MKKMLLVLVGVLALGTTAMAAPQAEEASDAQCVAATETGTEFNAVREPNHGVWHCTAYPNGEGHGHGHDAFDRYYYRAYWKAMRSCQYYHGRCHAHCHYDHH